MIQYVEKPTNTPSNPPVGAKSTKTFYHLKLFTFLKYTQYCGWIHRLICQSVCNPMIRHEVATIRWSWADVSFKPSISLIARSFTHPFTHSRLVFYYSYLRIIYLCTVFHSMQPKSTSAWESELWLRCWIVFCLSHLYSSFYFYMLTFINH